MAAFSTELIQKRQEKLAAAIQAAQLDGLALNPSPSLAYFTGLHFHELSERPVVVFFTPTEIPVIVLPELEAGKAESTEYELKAFPYGEDPDTWSPSFIQGAQAAGLAGDLVIGVEDRNMRLLELRLLETAMPQAIFSEAIEITSSLRMAKDKNEIGAMKKAAEIAEQAWEATKPMVKAGVTEQEIAGELTLQLLRSGSEPKLPFTPLVAGGPDNSPNPHHFPGGRKLQTGDLLIVDWGATADGYFSDITRTFGIGEVGKELQTIHQTVQAANAAGRQAAKPGATCDAVDKAARDAIEAAGYGKYFIHRTGHGLGMEGHEAPYIRAGNPMKLEAGMTFTVEPGIYIPGKGGVRIEDNVAVTADGLDVLTSLPRELILL
jgi:Xaa-Pro dipeptidase